MYVDVANQKSQFKYPLQVVCSNLGLCSVQFMLSIIEGIRSVHLIYTIDSHLDTENRRNCYIF